MQVRRTGFAGFAVALVFVVASGRAQSQEKLVFEVASIKRVQDGGPGGGAIPLAPGVTAGGGIRSFVPLFNLICWAYRLDWSQVSGGPSWVRTDRYAIEAKPEKEEFSLKERDDRTRERVKALLADRFKLVIRTESKEASVYVLSVAKGGHKLSPDPEGKGGVRFLGDGIEGFGAPIGFLGVSLTQALRRPVLDETGLDGRYKFKFQFRPENAEDDPRPSIFTAIRSELGLELQSRKGPLPTLVIERIEKPTEN